MERIETMRYKKLGSTDMSFSVIGLGTWAMGGEGWQFSWGPQDDRLSIQTINHALSLGINWIDTAAVYGLGHSETVVGRALKGMTERPFIATKGSRKVDANGVLYSDLKKESIIREAEDSLRRLQVDVIDLYQLHWPRPDEDIEEGWQAVAALIQQGKVRYGGVSNFNSAQMQRCLPIHPIASLQPPFNMLTRDIEHDVLTFCDKQNIGVIGYSPLYKGLFTGKFSRERMDQLPASDHRRNDSHFQEPELSLNLQLVKDLAEIAAVRGVSVAQLTIGWCLRLPQMTAAIVGGRKPEQIEEIAPAGDLVLSDQEIAQIDSLLKQREEALAAKN
jgi:aryl-alcohol dehydrogenase-like predicted oxidoreductase